MYGAVFLFLPPPPFRDPVAGYVTDASNTPMFLDWLEKFGRMGWEGADPGSAICDEGQRLPALGVCFAVGTGLSSCRKSIAQYCAVPNLYLFCYNLLYYVNYYFQ